MSWLTDPSDSDWEAEAAPPRKSHARLVVAIVAGWLVVSLLVLAGLILFRGTNDAKDNKAARTASGSGQGSTAGSTAGSATTGPTAAAALPDGWVARKVDDQTNCAAHSYGKVAQFFAKTPCVSVHRVLATTTSGGRPAVIATNTVTFATATQATQYLALVTSDGTGNINDLFREGIVVSGVKKLPNSAFASKQSGTVVRVAEAAYLTGASHFDDAGLHSLAEAGLEN